MSVIWGLRFFWGEGGLQEQGPGFLCCKEGLPRPKCHKEWCCLTGVKERVRR